MLVHKTHFPLVRKYHYRLPHQSYVDEARIEYLLYRSMKYQTAVFCSLYHRCGHRPEEEDGEGVGEVRLHHHVVLQPEVDHHRARQQAQRVELSSRLPC